MRQDKLGCLDHRHTQHQQHESIAINLLGELEQDNSEANSRKQLKTLISQKAVAALEKMEDDHEFDPSTIQQIISHEELESLRQSAAFQEWNASRQRAFNSQVGDP